MKNFFVDESLAQPFPINAHMQERYRERVLRTPVNTAYAFRKLYGKSNVPDANWGDHGTALAIRFQDMFCDADTPSGFLVAGRHRVLVFWESQSRNLLFIDADALHTELISLNEILLEPGKVFPYKVFPLNHGHLMTLEFDEQSNCLIEHRHSPGHVERLAFHLSFLSRQRPDPYREDLLYHEHLKSLSIQVISQDQKYLASCTCPLPVIAFEHLHGRTPWIHWQAQYGKELFSSDDPAFYDVLSLISSTIGKSPTHLVHFFAEAVLGCLENMSPLTANGNAFNRSLQNVL